MRAGDGGDEQLYFSRHGFSPNFLFDLLAADKKPPRIAKMDVHLDELARHV